MKVITNEKLIKRNARIGQIATVSGLLVLVGGMVISFRNPSYASLAWVALLLGFALSQIGLYFGNRWGRHPRPDERLDESLKALNNQYSLYHYATPASHLLVGPTGLWVLMPYHQGGNIVFEKNRYKQRGGGFMQKYLRVFGQEGLGRPDLEGPAEVATIDKFIKKYIPDVELSETKVAVVFVNERAELEVKDAPLLSVPIKDLKKTITKTTKEKTLTPEILKQINELFV
jgi:hypothetical protein